VLFFWPNSCTLGPERDFRAIRKVLRTISDAALDTLICDVTQSQNCNWTNSDILEGWNLGSKSRRLIGTGIAMSCPRLSFTRSMCLMALVFIAGIQASWAAVYYVDATGGRNDASGLSPSAAWKTTAKVSSSSFLPGDQILFKRGEVWRETLVVPSSGSPGSPTVFGSYGVGTNPIITGADALLGKGTRNLCLYAAGKDYITIQDITFEGARQQLLQVSSCNNWIVRNITGRNGIAPDVIGARGMFFINDAHISISNIELYGTHGDSGINIGGCQDFMISGSRIHDHQGDGIYVANSASVTIQDNTLYGQTGEWADNIQLSKTSNYMILRNNTSLHGSDSSKGNIIAMEGSNGLIQGNMCGYGAYGVNCSDDNSIIEFNIVHDHFPLSWHSGLYMASGLPSDNITWRYNISYDDNIGILADTSPSARDAHTNIKIYNNTIVGSKRCGAVVTNVTGIFKNNIVWSPEATMAVYFVGIIADHGTWISDKNDIGPEMTGFIQCHNRIYNTLRSYTDLEAQDTHSISAYPMFTDPGKYDFSLQAKSPCVNGGSEIDPKSDISLMNIGASQHKAIARPNNLRFLSPY
jgi:parallel beta-helix repeat protein